jgi:hypothetical protein
MDRVKQINQTLAYHFPLTMTRQRDTRAVVLAEQSQNLRTDSFTTDTNPQPV